METRKLHTAPPVLIGGVGISSDFLTGVRVKNRVVGHFVKPHVTISKCKIEKNEILETESW